MFEFMYETRYGDFKDFENIKTGALLDIIQDIAIKDSQSRGYGIHVLREMNQAWLMQGISLRILKPVSTKCSIDAFTSVAKMGAATSNRGCILRQNGEVVAKSIASWFLMDIVNVRPMRIPKDMLAAYESFDFNDDFFKYKKPDAPEFKGEGDKVYVSNRDIDTNCHLNNEKAVEIMLDVLPYDYSYNAVDIIYKRESHLGDCLTRRIEKDGTGYWVELSSADGESSVVAHIFTE